MGGKTPDAVWGDGNLQALQGAQVLRVAPQGGDEPEIIECRWTQAARDAAHGPDRFCGHVAQPLGERAYLLQTPPFRDAAQPDQNRGQGLACLVVKLAGHAFALVFLC